MKSKIAVVILNYKHYQDTQNCLTHIYASDLPKKSLVIIADNSTDSHRQTYLKNNFPQITLIQNPLNLGFAGGNNPAIKYALNKKATHILIINPDVTIPKIFFLPLLKTFSKFPDAHIVAPAITHRQKNQNFYGLDGYIDWRFAKPHHYNFPTIKDKSIRLAQFVTFACVLIKSDTFKKIGFLDEGYFMYFEDVDFCLTAVKKNLSIYLNPQIIVKHNTSSSFQKPTQKLWINFKSHLRFIKKWSPFPQKIIPYIYVLFHYPYLYLLWSYHYYKYSR